MTRLMSGTFNRDELQRLLAQLPCKKSAEEKDPRESLRDPLSFTLIATDHEVDPDRYLGTATLTFRQELTKWYCDIHSVIVNSGHRRRGIGDFLMKGLLEIAIRHSPAKNAELEIHAECCPENTATNALCRKSGFDLDAEARESSGMNHYKMVIKPK